MTEAASVASATAVGWTTGVLSKKPSFCVVAVPILVPVVVDKIKLLESLISILLDVFTPKTLVLPICI